MFFFRPCALKNKEMYCKYIYKYILFQKKIFIYIYICMYVLIIKSDHVMSYFSVTICRVTVFCIAPCI